MQVVESDVVVVGGGTAGCIVAARVSEDPGTRVTLLEWGVNDADVEESRYVRRWLEMLEGPYDLDYRSVPQQRGNSDIRQARARILGGCATHNTMIAFKPPVWDLEEWVSLGAAGWGPDDFLPYYDRLATTITPVAPQHRNAYLADVITAASSALELPVIDGWNSSPWRDGTGWLEIAYRHETGERSKSSSDYIHPLLGTRANLEVRFGARATRLLVEQGRVVGVETRRDDGTVERVMARREVVLCAGAIDTPRLMLLSGIGPGEELRQAGVDVAVDLPGVGRNLQDHPEALLIWEASQPIPPEGATDWDIAVIARTDPSAAAPDVMMHVPLTTYDVHSLALGVPTPEHSISMTPNVPKPRSRGSIRLAGPDPDLAPIYDPAYLTDPDGYDEAMLLKGVELARRIAATAPMSDWIAREAFPGPASADELRDLVRRTHHTVYHVSGTARMGADDDPLAVCDPELRVRGVEGLRVADASAFPSVTSINPMVTIFMLAERAADLIRRG